MRARKKPWAINELEINNKLILNPDEHKGYLQKLFNNAHPIHIEIGCGNGKFITETAMRNTEINHIAIEREQNVIVTGMRVARENEINIFFILGDAKNLENYFEPKEIERIYINFCDPWPNRKKWHKRRLTHSNFLKIYENLLTPKGEIFFKTDNKELFDFSLEQFIQSNWKLKDVVYDLHASDFKENIMTEYEEKFHKLGMPIYRCCAYH